MADLQRPTRVVVVDVDDPMSEIKGEFFWREDHEQLLAQAREAAYRAGFDDGLAAGASRSGSTVRVVRVRGRRHVLARTVAALVAVTFVISLLASFWR